MRLLTGLVATLLAARVGAADPPAAGLRPGDEVSAWEPVHVAGPRAGTKTCPVCTYLDAPVLLAFARDADEAGKLAAGLERIAAAHGAGRLKVMLVAVSGTDEQLKAVAKDCGVKHLMLCRPDPERKDKQLKLYKVDPTAINVVLFYQDYTVRKVWAAVGTADLPELAKAADAYRPKE